jgi:hypothetical protein
VKRPRTAHQQSSERIGGSRQQEHECLDRADTGTPMPRPQRGEGESVASSPPGSPEPDRSPAIWGRGKHKVSIGSRPSTRSRCAFAKAQLRTGRGRPEQANWSRAEEGWLL